MLTLILFNIVLLLIFITLKKWKRTNYPPGPFPWPIIGNKFYAQKLSREHGGLHNAFMEMHKYYNSKIISLKLGSNNVIVVSDSKLIHEILNKKEYDGRPWNEFVKIRNLGMKNKGITMNDGVEWKKLRGWTVCALKNVGFATRKMEELIGNELDCILTKLDKGGVHDIKFVISPAVINVLWKLLAGQQLCNDNKLQYFIELLERRAKCFDITGGFLSSLPWLRYIMPNVTGYNIVTSINKELKNLLMTTINEHKQRYVEGAEADFIDLFLREMMKEKMAEREVPLFTDDNLLISLIDFFIAGINNTTVSLNVLFLHMLNYQEVQDKLHKEIDQVIGPDRFPSLEDRPKMHFTEAVLTECQRVCVVAPIIGPRRVLADTSIGGYTIPKNVTVLMSLLACTENSELYPDTTSFRPERFIKDGVYQSDDNILTFGKGKRRCPGEALAKSAIFLLFVGIMQKYRLLSVPGEKVTTSNMSGGMTVSPKPYKTLLVPR